jgi:glycosyltransferase involved in cell wall biosynthesis
LFVVVIAILSRLTYRKGTDLMCVVIPAVCKKYPHVIVKIGMFLFIFSFFFFLFCSLFICPFCEGGDGDRRFEVEKMIDKYNLRDRVFTRGNIPHEFARDVCLLLLLQGKYICILFIC